MKMHKEEYEKLMLKFALEMSEVGVTKDIRNLIKAKLERIPNAISASESEVTDRFVYRHGGYMIEAKRTVELIVKTCK